MVGVRTSRAGVRRLARERHTVGDRRPYARRVVDRRHRPPTRHHRVPRRGTGALGAHLVRLDQRRPRRGRGVARLRRGARPRDRRPALPSHARGARHRRSRQRHPRIPGQLAHHRTRGFDAVDPRRGHGRLARRGRPARRGGPAPVGRGDGMGPRRPRARSQLRAARRGLEPAGAARSSRRRGRAAA